MTQLGWTMLAAREAFLLWSVVKFPRVWAAERRSALARARNGLRCDVATRLSDCHYFITGRLPPPLALSLFAARAAERSGDLSAAAPPYGFLGYAFGLMGLRRVSRFCIERTIPACTRAKNMFGLQRAYGGKLLLAISLGEWETARPLLDSSLAFRSAYRSDVNHGMALSLRAQFNRYIGDLPTARRDFEALGTLGRTISDDQFVGWSHLGFARVALCDRDPATVEREAEQGLAVLGRTIEVQALFILEALRVVAVWRQGRHDEAAGLAESLVARAEGTPLQFASGEAFGAVAETMNGLFAHYGSAASRDHRRRAERATKRLRQFAKLFPIGRPLAALHEGQLARLLGQKRKAVSLWERGLKIAEAMPMRYEAARLHAALASLPELESGSRERHTQRADELAAACGAGALPALPLSLSDTQGE
jgi:tetratricopeptide (TPR) repeat protein